MQGFLKIAEGADFGPLRQALFRKPYLWGENRIRTDFPNSPHAEVEDILLRFSDIDCAPDDPGLDEAVESSPIVWQPAWAELAAEVKPVLLPLLMRVGAYELARVMITKLRPGGVIKPHADVRGDYTNSRDAARYHMVIQGRPGSLFHVEQETVQMLTGEVYAFDWRKVHSVQNNSDDDRVHLLVDCKVMP